ncbi:hypothetical protein [Pyrobaculum neutrophilum]|nr:hypothetical protein [Pyrobaculum neutrophilum]
MYTITTYEKRRTYTVVAYVGTAVLVRRGVPKKLVEQVLRGAAPRKRWLGGRAASYKSEAGAVLRLFPLDYFAQFCTDGLRLPYVDELMKAAYKSGLLDLPVRPGTIKVWIEKGLDGVADEDEDIDPRCFIRRYGKYHLATPPWCCTGS